MKTRRTFLLTTLAAGGLAGCNGILPNLGEAPQLYVLTPKTTYRPDLPKIPWQLLVDLPFAPAEIDTSRIALSRSPVTVDYFANAAWPDRAPVMVQTLLVESFESTGKITAIGRESVDLRADYILKPELRRFIATYDQENGPGAADGPPLITVKMNVRLIALPDRAIVAQTTVERDQRAERNSMDAIVAAFDDALGAVLKRIVEWTLLTPPRAPHQAPSRPAAR